MTDSSPRVIACLPCYNAEVFIERTLTGLQNQTYSNFRVLISDDGSQDRTVELIENMISHDSRFTLIKQGENLGWVGNMNAVLSEASGMGDYVFICTHDDVPDSRYIEKMVRALEDNSGSVIAYGDIKWEKVNGEIHIVSYPEGHDITDKMERLKTVLSKKCDYWVFYRGVMKADMVKNILPLEKNLFGHREYHSDWLWLVKIAREGKMIRVPGVSFTKYNQPTSYSGTWAYNAKNYLGVLMTCSWIVCRFPMKISQRLSLQILILDLAARYLIMRSGLLSLFRNTRAIFKNETSVF